MKKTPILFAGYQRRLGAIVLCLCCATAYALDPAYLEEFPDMDRIVADTNSGDRFDDLARQAGIVRQLRETINILAGQRRYDNQLTPDEQRLIAEYWEADAVIKAQAEVIAPKTTSGSGDPPWTKWYLLATRYELDDDLREWVIGRYFSAETLRRLGHADADHAALAARGAAELNAGMGLKPKSRWESQTADELYESILVLSFLTILALPFLYREMRRFGIVPGDPRQLIAGFRRYHLQWFSGIVEDYSKSTETTTTTTTTHYTDGSTRISQGFSKTSYE